MSNVILIADSLNELLICIDQHRSCPDIRIHVLTVAPSPALLSYICNNHHHVELIEPPVLWRSEVYSPVIHVANAIDNYIHDHFSSYLHTWGTPSEGGYLSQKLLDLSIIISSINHSMKSLNPTVVYVGSTPLSKNKAQKSFFSSLLDCPTITLHTNRLLERLCGVISLLQHLMRGINRLLPYIRLPIASNKPYDISAHYDYIQVVLSMASKHYLDAVRICQQLHSLGKKALLIGPTRLGSHLSKEPAITFFPLSLDLNISLFSRYIFRWLRDSIRLIRLLSKISLTWPSTSASIKPFLRESFLFYCLDAIHERLVLSQALSNLPNISTDFLKPFGSPESALYRFQVCFFRHKPTHIVFYWSGSTAPAPWPFATKFLPPDIFFCKSDAELKNIPIEYPQSNPINAVSSYDTIYPSYNSRNSSHHTTTIAFDLSNLILGYYSFSDLLGDLSLLCQGLSILSHRQFRLTLKAHPNARSQDHSSLIYEYFRRSMPMISFRLLRCTTDSESWLRDASFICSRMSTLLDTSIYKSITPICICSSSYNSDFFLRFNMPLITSAAQCANYIESVLLADDCFTDDCQSLSFTAPVYDLAQSVSRFISQHS